MADIAEQADNGSGLAEFAVELSQSLDGLGSMPAEMDMPAFSAPEATAAAFLPSSATTAQRSDVDNLIMDIPVTLKVVLGTAKMPVAAISKMARGTVIKLDNKVGDPVDIYVNGRFLAQGQVVVLDEGSSRFGVTLTQVGGLQNSKR
ncbi:MAG TPA: flagellar motor switch protein FliN [Hyphomicrobium sp.]|nr:flagellar motor switch protein FliN [Hyphomicrobium sp.]